MYFYKACRKLEKSRLTYKQTVYMLECAVIGAAVSMLYLVAGGLMAAGAV